MYCVPLPRKKNKIMILPSQTEDQVLGELDQDHAWIVSRAKKEAKKQILKIQKTGLVKKDYEYEYRVTTPNNNRWYIFLNINVLRHQKVYMSCNCSAESTHGTLDYYMIRGYTFGGLYFVRVTSHTISRIKERCPEYSSLDGNQICTHIFNVGEECGGMKLTDHRFIQFIDKADDSNEVCILLTTLMGVFFTYQTPGHNCLIKTYISSDMVKDGIEREIYDYCRASYVFLNQKKFSFCEEVINACVKIVGSYRAKYGIAPTGFCYPE